MRKLIPLGDSLFKLGEKILIPFNAYDDSKIVHGSSNTTAVFNIKNSTGFVKSVTATLTNNNTAFNLNTNDLADLTADTYFLELWVTDSNDDTVKIYPDDSFTTLTINENATVVKGNVLPEISLDNFKQQIADYLKDNNMDCNGGSTATVADINNILKLFSKYYQIDASRASVGVNTHNYYDKNALQLFNYTYKGETTAYYPFNSSTGNSATLSPIPIDKATQNSGVQVDFDLVTTADDGTFNVVFPDFSNIELPSNPIKKGTNHYSFFATLGAVPSTQLYINMGLCLHNYTGTLGIQNLVVRVNNAFVDYQQAYSAMITAVNKVVANQSTTTEIDIFKSGIVNDILPYFQARDNLTSKIEQGLASNIDNNKNILTVTNANIASLGKSVLTLDPTKVKSGNISAFTDMDPQTIKTQAQALNLNTVTVSLLIRVNSLTDSNCVTTDDDWNKVKADVSQLQAMGLRVLIQPYPYIDNGKYAEVDWTPSDTTTFFKTYSAIINQIAQYAQTAKLDGMYIATNLIHLEQYEDNWVNIIKQVKSVYSGKVYFRTNWWRTASWDSSTVTAYQATLNRSFWQYVDVIAIAAYFEVTAQQNPTSQQIQTDLYSTPIFNRQQDIVSEIKAFNDKWHKPIFFGELGIPPYSDACAAPYQVQMDSNGVYSEITQSNWFDAWYTVFNQFDWWLGYSIFEIGSTSPYNPYGKLAQSTIAMQTFGGSYKPATYITDTMPLAPNKGDVWFVSDNNNITAIKQWNGSEWVSFNLKLN